MSAHVSACQHMSASQRLQETEVLQSMWQVQLDHCVSKDVLQEMPNICVIDTCCMYDVRACKFTRTESSRCDLQSCSVLLSLNRFDMDLPVRYSMPNKGARD